MLRTILPLLLLSISLFAQSPVRPGDRVAIIGNTFADQLRTHGYLETLLLQRSSEKPVSIRNLGWAGDMLGARDRPTNFPSETSTLTEHKTDVIIACFGMGESFAGEPGLPGFKQALNDLIASHRGKQYNGTADVRLVFVSPIAYEKLGPHTPNHERRNRELAAYTTAMREVAAANKLAFVDLFTPTTDLMAEPDAPALTRNGVNPNATGYWGVSRTLADALLPGPTPWRFDVDAASQNAKASGAAINEIERDGFALTFKVAEKTWPTLAPPTDIHPSLVNQQDRLTVKNLAAGSYQLTVDGQAVLTATAAELAAGVPLTSTPAHTNLETHKRAIHDKNQHFVYSWKALNQVHIVGERRTSASGRALPNEVIAFNKLTQQKDAALAKGIDLKTRTYRLTPQK